MERRRALAVAGSLTITAFAGAIAAGASTGLFGLGTVGGAATPSAKVAPVTRPAPKVVEVTVPSGRVAKAESGSGGAAPAPSAGYAAAAEAPAPAPAPAARPAPAPVAAPPVRSSVSEPGDESHEPEHSSEGRERDD